MEHDLRSKNIPGKTAKNTFLKPSKNDLW